MRKTGSFTYKVDKKQQKESQVSLIKDTPSSLANDISTNFLGDELDDEPMEVLDLY